MVPTFDEYASTCAIVSRVPAGCGWSSVNGVPPRIRGAPAGTVASPVIRPSCNAAATTKALWVEPGSAARPLAASTRSAGAWSSGFAALKPGQLAWASTSPVRTSRITAAPTVAPARASGGQSARCVSNCRSRSIVRRSVAPGRGGVRRW